MKFTENRMAFVAGMIYTFLGLFILVCYIFFRTDIELALIGIAFGCIGVYLSIEAEESKKGERK